MLICQHDMVRLLSDNHLTVYQWRWTKAILLNWFLYLSNFFSFFFCCLQVIMLVGAVLILVHLLIPIDQHCCITLSSSCSEEGNEILFYCLFYITFNWVTTNVIRDLLNIQLFHLVVYVLLLLLLVLECFSGCLRTFIGAEILFSLYKCNHHRG